MKGETRKTAFTQQNLTALSLPLCNILHILGVATSYTPYDRIVVVPQGR